MTDNDVSRFSENKRIYRFLDYKVSGEMRVINAGKSVQRVCFAPVAKDTRGSTSKKRLKS